MELSNIDIKVDLMRSQRQLDIKVLNASAQVLIILSQNRNQVFNLDCYLDKQSEFNLNLKKDQVRFWKILKSCLFRKIILIDGTLIEIKSSILIFM